MSHFWNVTYFTYQNSEISKFSKLTNHFNNKKFKYLLVMVQNGENYLTALNTERSKSSLAKSMKGKLIHKVFIS